MIRPARISDAMAIAEVWNAVIRDSSATFTTREKTAHEIAAMIEAQPVFVTEEAAGFATYAPFRTGPGYAHTMEHTIHMGQSARRQGTGRALMEVVEDHARAEGAHSLIAGLSGENTGGIAFHAAIGFLQAARLPQVGWKFGRWHDLVLMQKFL